MVGFLLGVVSARICVVVRAYQHANVERPSPVRAVALVDERRPLGRLDECAPHPGGAQPLEVAAAVDDAPVPTGQIYKNRGLSILRRRKGLAPGSTMRVNTTEFARVEEKAQLPGRGCWVGSLAPD